MKARKERLFPGTNEKSTKPSTDNKIIVNSGTLGKNLRTTDSSELLNAIKNRDSSEKRDSKVSPYQSLKEKKFVSQYLQKPKLKIMKSKDPKQAYCKKIANPFNKQLIGEFDCSSKHSGISPHSRLKSGEISKDKKLKKNPSHKRLVSGLANTKSQALLGRSQTGITDENKSIKLYCDTLQQTHRQPLIVKNLFSHSSQLKCGDSNSKRKSQKKGVCISLKNLIYKKAIISYKDVAKNLETIKKIEKELKNELKSKSYKNLRSLANENEHEAIVLSGRKDGKHKTSFARPSLSVCFDQANSGTWK